MLCPCKKFWIYGLIGLIVVLTIQAIFLLNYINRKSYSKVNRSGFIVERRIFATETHRPMHLVTNVPNNRTVQELDTQHFTFPWSSVSPKLIGLYPFLRDKFILSDSAGDFIDIVRGIPCLKYGTKGRNLRAECLCNPRWYGYHCDIPESVQTSATYNMSYGNSKLTMKPRRIINTFTFNREWSMLEARLHELGSLVDVFVVLESNYTLHGDPKDLMLLNRLKKGYLKEFHHKILYIFLDHFPEGGREDGWIAEEYGRNYLSQKSLQKIKGTLPRDLFVYNDADEVPSFESMLFLKLHEGYSEPVGFLLTWACFGFFWTQNELFRTMSACSLQFLEEIASNNAQNLRGQKYLEEETSYKGPKYGVAWYIGSEKTQAGWHCSWCMPVEDVQNKLVSAINGDFPRWGDFPEKRELPYIRNLVKTGTWFNDEKLSTRNVSYITDPSIAPKYFLQNAEHFRFLLDVKYIG